jgi:hypothetical protein
MAIIISDTEPRVQYTATASQTSFTVPFEFFANADLKVYNGTTLLSYAASPSTASEYSVSGAGQTGGGSITLGGSGATLNDIITIYRDLAIERSTDFPTSGAFQIDSLNTELDKIISMCQQLERDLKFSPRAAATTANTFNITFPNLVANKVLNVNSAGNGLEFSVDKTDISTIAAIAADVTAVSNIAADVSTVAADGTDIGTVATNIASVNTCATNIADIITVANDLNEAISEIETVASDLQEASPEIDTVANNITNVNLVGNSIANVNTAASNIANINSVASNSSNINAVAANETNINLVNSNSTNINTVAGGIANVNAVGADIANVNTVANNLSGINSFNERYRVGATDPVTSLDSGDLNFNTGSSELKYYDGANWQTVASQDQNVKVSASDTSASVLDSKIAVSGGLTKTITNPGSNEVLTLSAQAAEVYGFIKTDTDGDGIADTLQVITTDGGVDNISSTTYNSFTDVIYGASGMTWSINSDGELRVTI